MPEVTVTCPYCGTGTHTAGWQCPACQQVVGPRGEIGKTALAAFVLGVLSVPWHMLLVPAILAIVLANQSFAQGEPGHGFAAAGRVLGWIGIALFAVVVPLTLMIFFFGFAATLFGAGGTPLD